MKVINLNNLKEKIMVENLVIGHFNIVHNGHIKLFQDLSNFSFLIFQDNPSKKFNLYNIEERIENLKKFSPKYIFVYNIFNDNCDAQTFINKYLLKYLVIQKIYVGSDYKFGKNKSGDVNTLKQHFNVTVVENDNLISTSKILNLIETGDIEQANSLMTQNFYYSGIVVKGKGIARKNFFPTANIIENKNIIIRHGSYVSRTFIDGKEYKSISFIGIPKSLEALHNFVETYIFDFNKDIYGKFIKVEILKFIRDNQKFDNIQELIKNINNDLNVAKNYFK